MRDRDSSRSSSIEERVRNLGTWFHNLTLDGLQTAPHHPLGDYPRQKWQRFAHALPADLSGRTVLDIGCNAGFYSIEMKRRGAARVVGLDSDARYLAQARLAAEVNDMDIEFQQGSVYDVARLHEQFDLVLFLGVLYHLRYPLLALDLIHDTVARDLLVFQSMLRGDSGDPPIAENYTFANEEIFQTRGFPLTYFVEQRYANDPTNWWIPNRAGAQAMLRSAGFDILSQPEAEVFVCRNATADPRAEWRCAGD